MFLQDRLHFSGWKVRQEYQHQHCEYCHQQGVLGDETYIFLRCQATTSLIGKTVVQINKKLLLFDVLPWSSFTDTQRVSILLGNPPPQEIHEGVDAGVCPLAPNIHDEALVPPRHPTTPTSFRVSRRRSQRCPLNTGTHTNQRGESAHTHTYHTHTHTHIHIHTYSMIHIG